MSRFRAVVGELIWIGVLFAANFYCPALFIAWVALSLLAFLIVIIADAFGLNASKRLGLR
jgi:hypothetical protein